jgi:hypothetical protein
VRRSAPSSSTRSDWPTDGDHGRRWACGPARPSS